MGHASTGQVNLDAANVYDAFFVPALFEQWPPHIVARSGIGRGERVLDVAFEDRVAALREMLRVLRPRGRLVVAVWSSLDETPGYAAMVRLLERLFGSDVARALEAPFCLGDSEQLRDMFLQAGAVDPWVETVPGTCRFPSLGQWVHTDIRGWTLADLIDDEQFDRLCREAPNALSKYVRPDGRVEFEAPARLVAVRK
jgi:SAM-dependent methyltransferase